MVIFSHRSFTFENLNGDSLLIILIGSKNLAFFSRNKASSWNNDTHDTSDGFNTQRQRSGINNDQSFSLLRFFTTNNTSLNGCSISDGFIRIYTSIRFFTVEEIFNNLSDFRNSSGTSDQDDFINLIFI